MIISLFTSTNHHINPILSTYSYPYTGSYLIPPGRPVLIRIPFPHTGNCFRPTAPCAFQAYRHSGQTVRRCPVRHLVYLHIIDFQLYLHIAECAAIFNALLFKSGHLPKKRKPTQGTEGVSQCDFTLFAFVLLAEQFP